MRINQEKERMKTRQRVLLKRTPATDEEKKKRRKE